MKSTSKCRSPAREARWSALQALESYGIRRTREGYYYIAHYYPLKAMHPVRGGEPKQLLDTLSGTEVETYVHFPFCEIRCSFCHFYKEISRESSAPNLEQPILDAVLTEISRTVDVIGKIKARSFYVGGGTPSLITLGGLDRLLACVDKNFEIVPNAEVKFELFPKRDISDRLDALLAALSSFGVTDIVVDLESGNQASLNYVGRSISSMDGYLDVIDRCVAKGFKSIVTGLIIGLPYETEATLLQTLETLAAIPEITVINTFPLITRYPDPIWRQLKSRPDLFHSSQSRDQLWLFARDFLRAKGFVEGPISYLRRPGKVPRQQFDKFECVNLIAFGPSAFGYINSEHWSAQYFNLCNATDYIKAVNAGGLPMWRAGVMDNTERSRRRLIFALANCRPVCLADVEREFNVDLRALLGRELNALHHLELIEHTGTSGASIRYTELGLARLEEASYYLGSDYVNDAAAGALDRTDPGHLELARHHYYIDVPLADRQRFRHLTSRMPARFP